MWQKFYVGLAKVVVREKEKEKKSGAGILDAGVEERVRILRILSSDAYEEGKND